jgi:hypothetical protein
MMCERYFWVLYVYAIGMKVERKLSDFSAEKQKWNGNMDMETEFCETETESEFLMRKRKRK